MTNIIIAGTGTDEYLELASNTKTQGRLFRKQILHMGSFAHPSVPGKSVVVDRALAEQMVTNFKNGVCDIVQVPIVDDSNRHVENPERNIGRVVDLSYDDKGVYATIDAVKHADDLGKTLIGASAMINMDYTNTSNGEKSGATLLHVAVTNRPYITKLDDFEEIGLSNSNDEEETVLINTEEKEVADTNSETVLLGAAVIEENPVKEITSMTKDELIAALKADHNIDVAALLKTAEETAQLSNILGADNSDTLKDISEAVVELSHKNDELVEKLTEQSTVTQTQAALIEQLVEEGKALKLSAAEMEIDQLIKAGRVLPKQKAAMLTLSVNDRETFDALLPDESIVSLSEEGVTTHQDTRSEKLVADLDRYSQMVRDMARGKSAE